MKEWIPREFGLESSPNQVIRILRVRVGLYVSKPLPHEYRRPPEAEEPLKGKLHPMVTTWQQQGIGKDDLVLGFLAEVSSPHRVNPVWGWSFEKNPVVDKHTTPVKSNTIGCYPSQGVRVQGFLATSQEDAMVAFLKQVKAANATAKAMVIGLDNYKSHWAAKVTKTAPALGIYLIHLPPYSPDLNPIGYSWKRIKRILSREFMATLDEMKSKIADGWKSYQAHLILQSIGVLNF